MGYLYQRKAAQPLAPGMQLLWIWKLLSCLQGFYPIPICRLKETVIRCSDILSNITPKRDTFIA